MRRGLKGAEGVKGCGGGLRVRRGLKGVEGLKGAEGAKGCGGG